MISPFTFLFILHHEEATLDHVAKTAFGFNSVIVNREIIPDKKALLFSPFAEYSFLELKILNLSARADIPLGIVQNKFYFSDIAGTIKATVDILKIFSITPLISAEFPTGGTLATSGHLGLLPGVAFEIHAGPIMHIHGLVGLKLALGESRETSSESETGTTTGHLHAPALSSNSHKVNYLIPHSANEIMSHIGVMFGILDIIGIDIRPNFFLEEMKKFVFQPMAGLFLDLPAGELSIKSHLYGFYAMGGVRKGYGIGLMSYLMF